MKPPVATDEEKAEFRARVRFTLGLFWALASFFVVFAAIVIYSMVGAFTIALLRSLPIDALLVSLAITCAAYVVSRRATLALGALDVTSLVAVLGLCWSVTATTMVTHERPNPELFPLFACTCVLSLHASLVPSTWLRTMVIGVAAFGPLCATSYVAFVANADPHPIRESSMIVLMVVVAIACPTVVSHVIYGLRLRARDARQVGRYVLEQRIGEGAMGVVYRARHAMLRRDTAIKVMSDAREGAMERFEREVQATALLRHPNTVEIFDYGRVEGGGFYYAMEYLEGITLEELVALEGPQPVGRALHLLLQVCGALEEAHAHGLVHRDVKPANLMLTRRRDACDVVKVLDFGLVKDFGQAPLAASATSVVGTPTTMAPEVIMCPDDIDHRADLYALGVVAYYLLTGTYVFERGGLVETCCAHVHDAPLPPTALNPDIPEALEAVILACLAKAPGDRPQTAGELASRLRACAAEHAWSQADAEARWARGYPVPPRERSGEATLLAARVRG